MYISKSHKSWSFSRDQPLQLKKDSCKVKPVKHSHKKISRKDYQGQISGLYHKPLVSLYSVNIRLGLNSNDSSLRDVCFRSRLRTKGVKPQECLTIQDMGRRQSDADHIEAHGERGLQKGSEEERGTLAFEFIWRSVS